MTESEAQFDIDWPFKLQLTAGMVRPWQVSIWLRELNIPHQNSWYTYRFKTQADLNAAKNKIERP